MTSFTKCSLSFELSNNTWTIIYNDSIYKNVYSNPEQNALMNALKDEKVKYKIDGPRENIYDDLCSTDYFKITFHYLMLLNMKKRQFFIFGN